MSWVSVYKEKEQEKSEQLAPGNVQTYTLLHIYIHVTHERAIYLVMY